MQNDIQAGSRKFDAMNERKVLILCSSVKLFMERGFGSTSLNAIAAEAGLKPGNISYYFRTKEDIILALLEIYTEFQDRMIDELLKETKDGLLVFALKITSQIMLCEESREALALLRPFYALPSAFEYIKNTSAQRNFSLLQNEAAELIENDFRVIENITSCVEMSALSSFADRFFSVDDKVSQILRTAMHLYNVEKERQTEIVSKVKNYDCLAIGTKAFNSFTDVFDCKN